MCQLCKLENRMMRYQRLLNYLLFNIKVQKNALSKDYRIIDNTHRDKSAVMS